MTALANPASAGATLSRWLRLLFDRAPPLRFDSEVPYIATGTVHLPPDLGHWSHGSAAAAHAAAHLVYSPAGFDGAGLGPIARALVGALEDARVEALATRELPGLARLWRPLHTATPALGPSFAALLRRLSRALADPHYDDPDAWVQKGLALFFLDRRLGLAALRTPAEVRRAATLLGHDIGQMRLQLDAGTYRPAPAYRDDHRWMWAADVLESEPPPAGPTAADDSDSGDPLPADDADADAAVTLYPEWDRLIRRLRPDWSRVVERQAAPAAAAATAHAAPTAEPLDPRLLASPLRALASQPEGRALSDEGDTFEPAALVDWRVARRMRGAGDPRVFRSVDRRPARAAAWLLVDSSASTSASLDAHGTRVLQAATQAAAATAEALRPVGVACGVAAFRSNGRHAVDVDLLQPLWTSSPDAALAARLGALRPGGSTRLGAALRHLTRRLAAESAASRWIIVFSDGEPYDVDVHDARYLVEDARHAVRGAARQGVRTLCVAFHRRPGAAALRVFGRRSVCALTDVRGLLRAFQRLLR